MKESVGAMGLEEATSPSLGQKDHKGFLDEMEAMLDFFSPSNEYSLSIIYRQVWF